MKKATKWYWDATLQRLFEESRSIIAEKIKEGITRYDKDRWTALLTDWSRAGIGYIMTQKHCDCPGIHPLCCVAGWRVCMIGSSFLAPAETRYGAIEGECLGVVNALHKSRYYTMGCDKLIVCTDHKPLVPVLSTKNMDDIENPRLMRLKQKTLAWRFMIIHILGRELGFPDALSRHKEPGMVAGVHHEDYQEPGHVLTQSGEPVHVFDPYRQHPHVVDPWGYQENGGMYCKEVRGAMMAAIRTTLSNEATMPDPGFDVGGEMVASMEQGVRSITWEMVKNEVSTDAEYRELSDWVSGGCTGAAEELPSHIRPYWRLRDSLRCVLKVPMFGERTIIPKGLRKEVKEALHSAHQGVLAMGLRAGDSVFWPRIWEDLERVRQACSTCHEIAPSQANLPPVEPVMPDYPFQHVCVDYMSLGGKNYGVFVDRYTGWPGVYHGSAAQDVVTFLTRLCEDYGCPETLTSDGASNLTARAVESMLKDYGIRHRVSSVANPHANSRAELGVRTVKRMLRGNVGDFGKLDGTRFSRALLAVRNTPDRDTRMSPAQALLGRQLRDFLPVPRNQLMGDMWVRLSEGECAGQKSPES